MTSRAHLRAAGPRLPLVRDPDVSYYLRHVERHGLLLGPYESHAGLTGSRACRADICAPASLLTISHVSRPTSRRPARACRCSDQWGGQAGHQRSDPVCADGNPLLGPAASGRKFFHCCGVHFRDRTSRRCRPGHRGMGRQRRAGLDVVAIRLPPLLQSVTGPTCWRRGSRLSRTNTASVTRRRSAQAGRPEKTSPLYDRLLSAMGAGIGTARAAVGERAGATFARGDDPARPPSARFADRTGIGPLSASAARGRQRRRAGGSARLYGSFSIEGAPAAGAWLDHLIARPAARQRAARRSAMLLAARGHREQR